MSRKARNAYVLRVLPGSSLGSLRVPLWIMYPKRDKEPNKAAPVMAGKAFVFQRVFYSRARGLTK